MTWTGVSTDPVLIYVNGKLDSTTDINGTISSFSANSEPTLLGVRNNSSKSAHFDGQLDDVRIYNYALSAAQIRKVMNEAAGVRFGN